MSERLKFNRQQFTESLQSVQCHLARLKPSNIAPNHTTWTNYSQPEALLLTQPNALAELTEGIASDFSLHLFETLPSTNQKLWELLNQDASPGTVVIATQQTAGRGQWGRQWLSGLGGLYLSLALTPNLPAQLSGQLTLCSAWGIAAAFREYNLPVWIKWPNDLVLQGRKLGGILTETRVQQGQITKAVVGVGINWTNPVPETGINLQSFRQNHPEIFPSHPGTPFYDGVTSLESLAAVTLVGISSAYQFWQQQGINAILPCYEQLLMNRGQTISFDGQSGVIVGVSAKGNLRVRLHSDAVTPPVEVCLEPGTISLGYG